MTQLRIKFEPKSLLAFVVSVSLLAVLIASAAGNKDLASAAWPILIIAGIIWLIFVGFSIARNFSMR